MMHRWTNAPEAYDYQYCTTVDTFGENWRLVAITDPNRFEHFQIPRYASGFKTVVEPNSAESIARGLPEVMV